MGTNYYFCKSASTNSEDRIHIGKSSAGWHFALHVYPQGIKGEVEPINNLTDWLLVFEFPGSVIKNEYGDEISVQELTKIIVERSWPHKTEEKFSPDFLRQNHATKGLNGLLAHKIDHYHCIGHGRGTWDYVVSEFC